VSLIADNKLKRGTDVRRLENIIKYPRAVRALKKDGVDQAMSVVGEADPTADSRTFQKLKEATVLLQHLQRKELERLREEKPRQLLQDLFVAIKDAAKAAGVKL